MRSSVRCKIRNPRSHHKEVGSLHDKMFFYILLWHFLPLCFFPLLLSIQMAFFFGQSSSSDDDDDDDEFRFVKHEEIQFNFRFHLSKVSDACAKKLNYTVCKWHNREFYSTRHMHVRQMVSCIVNGGNQSLFTSRRGVGGGEKGFMLCSVIGTSS